MNRKQQWVVGIHAVDALIRNDPSHVREIVIDGGTHSQRLADLRAEALRKSIIVRAVPSQALDGIAAGVRHQGVAGRYEGITTRDQSDLPALIAQAQGRALLLILDGIQDPHNLGACLRSAAAAGVTAVIIPQDKSVDVNATVRKTAAGAADCVPIIKVKNLARCLRLLQQEGVWIYGLATDTQTPIYSLDLSANIGLVFGGEAHGLRHLTRQHCDGLVCIPMPGAIESLNVSVATGIGLFEVVRQRTAKNPLTF